MSAKYERDFKGLVLAFQVRHAVYRGKEGERGSSGSDEWLFLRGDARVARSRTLEWVC